jgi:hypothetical protein
MERTTRPHTLVRNWLSLFGIILAAFGFVAGLVFIALDIQGHLDNPYIGIFTYMVVPVFIIGGLLLTIIGAFRERKRRKLGITQRSSLPVINLNEQGHFISFIVVVSVIFLFISISGVGSYRAYHFTESVEFCGETCHSVMKPEFTAYQHSPHANTGCTTCHIGPGADFFVKSKLNGIYQVYSTMFEKYNRPIPTPVHNLRPAKETCYTCHWPNKFFGAIEMNRTYFRADEENTPWSIQMLIKVGGGDPEHGRTQGIHWHMAIENKIEYIATDEKRLEIPWVRMTHADGSQVVYQNKDNPLTEEEIANADIRVMDCIDCHNRPTHQFHSPERALNEALTAGRIDDSIPSIKLNALEALTGDYETEEQALTEIREQLEEAYPDGGLNVEKSIATVEQLYKVNFFPEMNVSWKEYPDHIGHMISPGCFRCHNGEHVSDDGQVISRECDSCHTIIAQGPGRELASITSGGLPFQHPEDIDEEWKESRCDDCHEGVPVM